MANKYRLLSKPCFLLSFFFFLLLSRVGYACPSGYYEVGKPKLSDLLELNVLIYSLQRVNLDYQTNQITPGDGFSFLYSSRTYKRYLKEDVLRKVSVQNNYCEISLSHLERFGHFWIRLKDCGNHRLKDLPIEIFNYFHFVCLALVLFPSEKRCRKLL